MQSDTATRLANPAIIDHEPLAAFLARPITEADILNALSLATGLEWKAVKYHVGGNGDVWFAESKTCPVGIPLSYTPRGAVYICHTDKRHFGERDYAGTELLVNDCALPQLLDDWLSVRDMVQA